MVYLRISTKLLGVISTIVLVRLLAPEDFGLMALAVSIYAFAEQLRTFNFGMAIIQNQRASAAHYHCAWSLEITLSIGAALLVVFAAPQVASFYENEHLSSVLYIMAMIIVVNGLANIGIIDFQKTMRFDREFALFFSSKVGSFLITIVLALALRNYWALVLGMLANALFSTLLSYHMHAFRPRFSLKLWRELMSFSSWIFINNSLQFFNQNIQNFILGKTMGPGKLGMFSVANEVSTVTHGELIAPINKATYPAYALLAEDSDTLQKSFLKNTAVIFFLSIPSGLGIAAIAPALVPVVFGEQWLDTIPLIKLLAIASIFTAIQTNAGYIFMALKKQYLSTLAHACRACLLIPLLIYLSASNGLTGAATAILVAAAASFPVTQYLVNKVLGISLKAFLLGLLRPALAGVLMFYVVAAYITTSNESATALQLITGVALGFALYSAGTTLLWLVMGKPAGPERDIIKTVKNWWASLPHHAAKDLP